MTARFGITGTSADAIARSIEQSLREGRLAGERVLPPVRAMADSLGVSPTTVAAAYRMLRHRGLVVGQGRKGTRIAHREAAPVRLPLPQPAGALNLADGNPDPELLPDLEPIVRKLPMPPELYGAPCVLPELAVAGRRLLEEDGVEASSLAVVSGAMDGIERVLATELRVGDKVAVEDPAFAGLLDLLGVMALVPVPFDVDEDGPVPESFAKALASGVRAVVVTPRAQNPTGARITSLRAAVLRRILDEHPSVVLVEDDHAAGVAGVPLHSLGSRRRARHAYVRSMAKSLGPDVRVALVAGSTEIVGRLEARQIVGMRWVSRLLQRLVVAALESRQVRASVARAEEEYTARRTAVLAALADRGVRATGASGLNLWIPVPEEAAVLQALALAGWSLAPGERFRLRSGAGVRVTVSRLRADQLGRFADDVAAAVAPRRATFSA